MSSFGNGILGTIQNQASAKGKTGHAKASSLPPKGGDFASTVASVAGRGGDGGRKGAGPSISAGAVSTRQVSAEQPRETQTKSSHADLSRIAEVLRKASAEPEQKTIGKAGLEPGIKVATTSAQQTNFEPGAKTDAASGQKTSVERGIKADVASEQKTSVEPGIKADVVSRQNTSAEPGIKADVASGQNTSAEPGIKAEAASEQKTGWQVRAEPSARAEAEPAQKVGGKAVPDLDLKAGAEVAQNPGGKADVEPGAKVIVEPTGKTGKALEEKVAVALGAMGKPDQKVPAETRDEKKAVSEETMPDKSDDVPAAADDTGTKTDVGNLLEMLTTPTTTPQAVAHAAAVVDDGAKGNDQSGDRLMAALDTRTDGDTADATASNADGAVAGPVEDAPESGADQLFRLIRADGKGREVDMSISADGERAAVRDANPINGAKAETVTVVDARRYIGLAETSNSVAVTSAIAQDPEWATSLSSTGGLAHSHAAATGKVVNTLKIQMHPIELGLVTATMRLHGDELTVSLQVQTAEAYRQLSDDQDAIVKALRDQGFSVDQVTVQLTPSDRGTSTPQGDGQPQQQQSQFSNQTQAREGGNGRQGGGEQAARNSGREDASHEGNTSENAPGLAGGQSLRSGGVYL